MHDPRLEDHALGIELQLAELVEQAERARVQGDDAAAAVIQAEMMKLQEELAETAEKVATEEPAEVDLDAQLARPA
jgi:N-formylglutamate amidohydrolase